MKISSRVGLIVIIIVIVAAVAGLYTVYSRQAADRSQLNESLDTARTLLPGLTATKKSLEEELAQAQSSLSTSQAQFPASVESIEYGEDFFDAANAALRATCRGCDVELTELTASPPAVRTVESVTYAVASFKVVVTGQIGNVLKFIDAIGTGIDYQLPCSFQLPWSVDVKSVDMVGGGPTTTVTINLDVYGYAR